MLAEEDLTAAALWYGDHQPAIVEPFLNAIRQAAKSAAEAPELYARVLKDLRRVLVRRFPYALLFQDSTAEVRIVACYHLHREPSFWQSRG